MQGLFPKRPIHWHILALIIIFTFFSELVTVTVMQQHTILIETRFLKEYDFV